MALLKSSSQKLRDTEIAANPGEVADSGCVARDRKVNLCLPDSVCII